MTQWSNYMPMIHRCTFLSSDELNPTKQAGQLINDINDWVSWFLLHLNKDKTEITGVGGKKQRQEMYSHLQLLSLEHSELLWSLILSLTQKLHQDKLFITWTSPSCFMHSSQPGQSHKNQLITSVLKSLYWLPVQYRINFLYSPSSPLMVWLPTTVLTCSLTTIQSQLSGHQVVVFWLYLD